MKDSSATALVGIGALGLGVVGGFLVYYFINKPTPPPQVVCEDIKTPGDCLTNGCLFCYTSCQSNPCDVAGIIGNFYANPNNIIMGNTTKFYIDLYSLESISCDLVVSITLNSGPGKLEILRMPLTFKGGLNIVEEWLYPYTEVGTFVLTLDIMQGDILVNSATSELTVTR